MDDETKAIVASNLTQAVMTGALRATINSVAGVRGNFPPAKVSAPSVPDIVRLYQQIYAELDNPSPPDQPDIEGA